MQRRPRGGPGVLGRMYRRLRRLMTWQRPYSGVRPVLCRWRGQKDYGVVLNGIWSGNGKSLQLYPAFTRFDVTSIKIQPAANVNAVRDVDVCIHARKLLPGFCFKSPQPPLDRPAHLSAETHLPVRMHVALVLLWGTSRGLKDVPWSGGMAALVSARLYGRQGKLDLHDPQRCFDEKPYASYLSHYVKR